MPTPATSMDGPSTDSFAIEQLVPRLFAVKHWRLAMGLQPLLLEDWIELGPDWAEQLQQKDELLTQRYSEVFASLPGSEAAQQEVLDLLVTHLLQYFPQHYQQQDDWLINISTGQRWCCSEFADQPLDLAGRLVQEDLCLLLPSEAGYQLAAASVCFPSRWSMPEKLGRPVAEIHQPVPGYDRKLARPVNQVFQRLQPAYSGYRFNWSIVDSPALFLSPTIHSTENSALIHPTITAQNAGEQLWLRIERQTLRRLSASDGILFTIRTSIYPLIEIVAYPTVAGNLAAILRQMPSEMQQYKSILPFRDVLLNYLESIGS